MARLVDAKESNLFLSILEPTIGPNEMTLAKTDISSSKTRVMK